jgi:hypothetical protein
MRDSEEWKLYQGILSEVERVFLELLKDGPFVLVSGGADGVDLVSETLAKKHGVEQIVHEPDYGAYEGRVAPLMRNKLIVRDADEMHAFPSPWSRGTNHTIGLMKKTGKNLIVYESWKRGI